MAARDPDLADHFAERREPAPPAGRPGASGDNHLTLSPHAALQRQAGFAHVCPVWQFGNSRVLVAIR